VNDIVRLAEKLTTLAEPWQPGVVGELNDYLIKLARLEGEFVWHAHAETDELFLCLSGELVIEMQRGDVALSAGDLYVVPKGVRHRPVAKRCAEVLLIEPRGVVNTGDAVTDRTAETDRWI